MRLSIRQATARDLEAVAGILHEAAGWLEERGMAMWREDELLPIRIAEDVRTGLFFLAECDAKAAGQFASSSKTNFSGPMWRRTTRRSFIDSLSGDALPAGRFLRR